MEKLVIMNYQHLENYYKGKKVFLTGHTGFKGSWLLCWLEFLGAEVMGYALPPEKSEDLYHVINGDSICHSILEDIRDQDKLADAILQFKPDFIFHLAAQPLVRRSYQQPVDTFEVNVIGTANILEAVRGLTKPCISVIVTTDKVYENYEKDYAYKETDRLGGYDPYSASKAASELVVNSYRNSFFNNAEVNTYGKSIASARAGNVIGGGDWAEDRIIPDIVRAVSSGSEIRLRNPKAIRPWQHVLDPLMGYLLLAARMVENPKKYSEAWNFGPMNEDADLSVKQLAIKAIEIWGQGSIKNASSKEHVHEAQLLKLDVIKSLEKLNWKPKLKPEKAIEWTLDFYKNGNSKEYLLRQILNYQSL